MKNLILVLIILASLGCEKESSMGSSAVYSDDGTAKFNELLLLMNIKATDSSYLVVESIDSIKIYINNYYWACVCTDTIDTTKINKENIGNMFVTSNKLNYLVTAPQDITQTDFYEAGDYAEYLTSAYEPEPGEYACLIESFRINFNDGTTQTYYPMIYKIFSIEEDISSVYVGEFEASIN